MSEDSETTGPAAVVPQTPPPTSTPTPTAANSVVGMLAELQKTDIATAEAALVATRAAYKRGETAAVEGALLDQFAVLQALGLKLLKIAGDADSPAKIQMFAHLGLRALDTSRKTLGSLHALTSKRTPTPTLLAPDAPRSS